MSDLPKGWVKVSLGQILELKYGKSLPAKVRTGQGVPVYGSNGVVGFHSDALISQSGLIVGRKGSFGVVHRCDEPFFPIDTTYFIDEFHDQPISYWYHFLRYLPLTAMNRSTAIPGLNREDAYGLEFGLPPLNEQFRIADKLDSMLAKVDAAQARLDKIPNILKRFRQSVLAAATSGELTKEWREENNHSALTSKEIEQLWINHYKKTGVKYKNPTFPLTDKEIEDLPAEWLATRLGDACDIFVGSTPSRKNTAYWGGEIPWVSSSEVAFCHINSTKEKISDLGLKNTSTKMHPKGTVMLAMIGQGKTRGQPAILDISACHNQNTAAIRVLPEIIESEYLYYFLWRQYEETRKVGAGNNQKALNKSIVQGFFLPLPSIEEQKEIVRRVESLFTMADTVEKQYKDAKARTNRLTQSILAKAFCGELVPQDDNDEPASELLARIKAASDNLTSKPKMAKKGSAK
ncbi:MAG: type I restriction enzyme S subunit [Oleiphilaceae bacterium]